MLLQRSHIILVPIDSNDQAVVALRQSYNLARLTRSKIMLLSVDDGKGNTIKSGLDELAKEAAEKTGQAVETIIKKGDLYEEVNKVADELNPLFIVIGITRAEGQDVKGKNKYALQMIHKSHHPIISVGGKTHIDGCNTIILPIDLSIQSREKIPRAVDVAKLFNSEIKILSVITDESKLEQNKLHMYANQCVKYISEHGVKASQKFIHTKENVTKVVFDYGKQVGADLIIIVSTTEVSIKEYFTGTAAQQLINNSDIPILTLRPIERKDTTAAIF